MRRALLALILLLVFLQAAKAQQNPFVGDWDVTLVKTNSADQPWKEIKYPIRMSIREEKGNLVGRYTDQYDYSDHFSVLAVQENEILFVVGGVGKKNISLFGPVHRAILRNGVLHGFVFTDRKLFEWTARKHKAISRGRRPTNRWTEARGACLVTCSNSPTVFVIAPPGQLNR